jgi:transposase InsO family protein
VTRSDKRAIPFPDLVKRDFTAPAPNVKWVGDMTEIPTDEGKLYVELVIHADPQSQYHRHRHPPAPRSPATHPTRR